MAKFKRKMEKKIKSEIEEIISPSSRTLRRVGNRIKINEKYEFFSLLSMKHSMLQMKEDIMQLWKQGNFKKLAEMARENPLYKYMLVDFVLSRVEMRLKLFLKDKKINKKQIYNAIKRYDKDVRSILSHLFPDFAKKYQKIKKTPIIDSFGLNIENLYIDNILDVIRKFGESVENAEILESLHREIKDGTLFSIEQGEIMHKILKKDAMADGLTLKYGILLKILNRNKSADIYLLTNEEGTAIHEYVHFLLREVGPKKLFLFEPLVEYVAAKCVGRLKKSNVLPYKIAYDLAKHPKGEIVLKKMINSFLELLQFYKNDYSTATFHASLVALKWMKEEGIPLDDYKKEIEFARKVKVDI